MSINLPEAFENRMKDLLGEEYSAFLAAYEQPACRGLRINPLKLSQPEVEEVKKWDFGLQPVPWCPTGYYFEKNHPGKHAFHQAGVYYIQEPSAMAPVEELGVLPGEKVLDLCAAPGGKSTQIAGKMAGQGILVTNEIMPNRAKILSENIERMGVSNAIVTNEPPEKLADHFPLYFDRILVDSPCSGEGMFRKNPEAIGEWSPERVEECVNRDDGILDAAYQMLRQGGRMVYSTCTFEAGENEEAIQRFLSRHPEMNCRKMQRIWPHKEKGEGHFLALLTKGEESPSLLTSEKDRKGERKPKKADKNKQNKNKTDEKAIILRFMEENCHGYIEGLAKENENYAERIRVFGEQCYLIPVQCPPLEGIHVLRRGLHLGTLKKDRMEPSHALALAMKETGANRICRLDVAEDTVYQYLHGLTFDWAGERGWTLILADHWSIGWGKCDGRMMKNHYPKGLRRYTEDYEQE